MKRIAVVLVGTLSLAATGCCGPGFGGWGGMYGPTYAAPAAGAYAPAYSTQAAIIAPQPTAVYGAPVTTALVPMESLPTY